MPGAVQRLAEKTFGGSLEEDSVTRSIGTTFSEVGGNDPERVFLLLVNLSGNTIFVGIDEQVSSSNGIRLGASGGSLTLQATEDFSLATRSWFAVAGAASSTLLVISIRRAFTVEVET